MQILNLCCPAAESKVSSKIWVMLHCAGQHGRAAQGALSPRLLPRSKPVHGIVLPGMVTLGEELSVWTSHAGHLLPSQITLIAGTCPCWQETEIK